MVLTGLDIFIGNGPRFKNRKIALIANHTSVNRDIHYIWDLLIEKGCDLKTIFTPEHGLFCTEQDQIAVNDQPSPSFRTVSLYGETYDSLIPLEDSLEETDLVIYDIQDIGARYYTYVNTLILFMQKISGRDIELIVLDRPNPISGTESEGPILKEDFQSFVGILPVPVRHGMTSGELALFARDYFNLDIDLKVIKMEGWDRNMFFDETGLHWIPPSPNMPSLSTALVYPGMCLLEGQNVSEGRGTCTPFEICGAPSVDAVKLAEYMNSAGLKGVYFRPAFYRPAFNKFSGETVGGVYIHVTDRNVFESFLTGVAVSEAFRKFYYNFMFRNDVYEFNTDHPAFDILCGSDGIRKMIISGTPLNDIKESWKDEIESFRKIKREYT